MPPKPHPKSKYATRDESQEQRSKAEKGAIAELPLLRFTENATENNFQIFREALQLYAMVHFKDLGRMIVLRDNSRVSVFVSLAVTFVFSWNVLRRDKPSEISWTE